MTPEEERAEIIRNAEEAYRQGFITLADLFMIRKVTILEITYIESENK